MTLECRRCFSMMQIREGEDPTSVCDHCAHEIMSELALLLRGAYVRLCAAHDHRQMFDDCIEPMCKENRATLLEWRFEEEITEALK